MKLVIGDYTVDIEAKERYHEKANKEDAMSFLAEIIIYLYEASAAYRRNGLNALAQKTEDFAADIYRCLDSNHYFNE